MCMSHIQQLDRTGSGWPAANGDVWVLEDHKGTYNPHWDVQDPDGTHTPIYPECGKNRKRFRKKCSPSLS